MPSEDGQGFSRREQVHLAVLFVVLFGVVWTARFTLPMPRWLLFVLGPLPLLVPLGVASWERRKRLRRGR